VGGPGPARREQRQQIRLARKIIKGLGLDIATPDDAREMLALKGGDKTAI
jgi:uncharacterized protein (DUF849 family)